MSKHSAENMADTRDTTWNASLEYIEVLVCDPTEVGDLVKAAREQVSINQIDIALAWYQKAENLLPHVQSAIAREQGEITKSQ